MSIFVAVHAHLPIKCIHFYDVLHATVIMFHVSWSSNRHPSIGDASPSEMNNNLPFVFQSLSDWLQNIYDTSRNPCSAWWCERVPLPAIMIPTYFRLIQCVLPAPIQCHSHQPGQGYVIIRSRH